MNEKLLRWIQGVLADLTEKGLMDRIELYHVVDGEGADRIKVWRLEEMIDEIVADDLSQEAWDAAFEDNATRTGGIPQRYVMHAYRKAEQQPESVFPFTMAPTGTKNFLLGSGSEAPTERGEKTQNMRHTENLHRMLIQMTESTTNHLAKEAERERMMRLEAENKFSKVFETYQQLLDRQHERQIESEREAAKNARIEKMMSLGMQMLPLVASKFLAGGAPIAGQLPAAAARDNAIGSLLGNLSHEELMKALNALKPENQLAFMEIYNTYREDAKNQVEEQQSEKAAQG